ncbi:hypothetical protein GCM10022406_35860 [Hymenobacter algoricola]|uniref:Uncharacterized protein n=1 Tax=Hymenobacter algoricola TaxID=486267 RepID=A0ABP7NND2_9BACT
MLHVGAELQILMTGRPGRNWGGRQEKQQEEREARLPFPDKGMLATGKAKLQQKINTTTQYKR